jgi:hypothetical protein
VARGEARRLRELGENLDAPLVAAHDGLDLPGDAVQDLAGGGRLRLGLERADLPHLVQVAHLHCRRRFHAGAMGFEMDWAAAGRIGRVEGDVEGVCTGRRVKRNWRKQ